MFAAKVTDDIIVAGSIPVIKDFGNELSRR